MTGIETWILWAHVAAGVVAVLTGVGAMTTEKGGWRHRQSGKAFVGSMTVVVGTVFPLLALDPSPFRMFLALVAVFSGYLAFSGYRVLSRKRPAEGAAPIDWTAAASVIVACLGLGGWGVAQVVRGDTFGVVMVVFGSIGLGFGAIDVRTFRGENDGGEWMVAHLQRMVGAFIATVSAVSAVNLTAAMGFVAWLWPTALGVPLIVYWSNEYGSQG